MILFKTPFYGALLSASFLAMATQTSQAMPIIPIAALSPAVNQADEQTLQSGDVELSLFKNKEGDLTYSVTYKKEPVVVKSALGMDVDHIDLGKGARLLEKKQVDDHTLVWKLESPHGLIYYVEGKVLPEGIALRYRFETKTPLAIYGDKTTIVFPKGTKGWYASGPFQYGWLQEYQERDMAEVEGELLAPPATFKLPNGHYLALVEGNLFDFHGAVLLGRGANEVSWGFVENQGHKETGVITGLPPTKFWHNVIKDEPWFAQPKQGASEIVTPWRAMMLASDLTELVNNKILEKICDAPNPELFPEGKNTDWIKPGRSVFTWLAEGGGERLSVANHKKFIDGCQQLGLESIVVDDGWELWAKTEKEANGRDKWQMLQELVDYGKERKVDVWVWRPSSPRWGNKSDVGLVDPDERNHFMQKCSELGVRGLKIDFFHTENAFTVRLMEAILRDAARHKLMVIFHGVNKPTGDDVTYPNLLAKEAVRGLECVGGEGSWAPGPAWPYHNTILPFTRWLVGGADYTPLNLRSFCHPSTTFGFQFASIYVLSSKMLIFAADMEDMLATPARSFIETVPVEWDEIKVLEPSAIGKIAVMAKRKGDIWYLCAINGTEAATLDIPLDFLEKGNYKMEVVEDKADQRREVNVRTETIKSGQTIKLPLLSGGGFVARFTKE